MFYQDFFSAELYTVKQVLKSALKKQKRLKQSITTDVYANVPDLRLYVIKTEQLIPLKYTEFLKVFSNTKYTKLPPLRDFGIDHAIDLKADARLPNKPVYPCSDAELTA
jgi:hypothetical protein